MTAANPFNGSLFVRFWRRDEHGAPTIDVTTFGPVRWTSVGVADGALRVAFSTGQHRSAIVRCPGPHLAVFQDGLWRISDGFPRAGETFSDMSFSDQAPAEGWELHALEPVVAALDAAWTNRRDPEWDRFLKGITQ